MNIKSAKSIVRKMPKFTIELLRELEKDGFLQNPLTDSDKVFLSQLHQVWGKEKYARLFLQKVKKSRRKLLLIKPLDKVGGYIFSRYFASTKSLKIKDVANEVHVYYKVPYDEKLLKKVDAVRRQAQTARWRQKKRKVA